MKFNVITGERLDMLLIGYGLVYESKYSQDRESIEDIMGREPIRIGIISTVHERFTRNPENGHLGMFPQHRPAENKDAFKIWLQDTYQKIPEVAKYLFD
ncbi:hypothetical protein HOC13_01580 [Candidatus Woesearchaeota archaeon]|jgi:hypothetical protein|nr:hypothetical protein [Candidatus Woesearchaeota archaeon]